MATLNVQNPSIPYLVKLNGPLLNRRITVEGCATPSSVRFAINLKVGGDADGDIALHFNPRFTYATYPLHVIRQSRINGAWGGDYEFRQPGEFPFKQGGEYKVQIVCEQERFMMYVDGEFLDYYKHRLPLDSITHLEIYQDTTVSLVQIDSPCDSTCDLDSLYVQNPSIPYLVELNGPLLNRKITVEGCVKPSAERFAISLKLGGDAKSDVAFCFNPRFSNPFQLICNSMINGVWGKEQTGYRDKFPFKQGREYKVQLTCLQERFEVRVDEMNIIDFYKHRLPLANITHLEITEDTTVSLVKIDSPLNVQNPSIPYLVKLNESLLNRRIAIEGCVKPSAVSFAISFKLGGDKKSDVAFCFNPRFNPNRVICNTMINGVWGTEQPIQTSEFPFKQGGAYKVRIICQQEHLTMQVDGKFVIRYKYRLPLANITHLEITEDTTVSLVKIDSPTSPDLQ